MTLSRFFKNLATNYIVDIRNQSEYAPIMASTLNPFKLPLLLVSAALLCLASYQVVIHTNVRAVEVSVIATDSKGQPVSGLGVGDFRVFDNGKEQTIASFEKIDSRAAPGQAALPPNTYSNRIGEAGSGPLGKAKQPQVLSMILLDAVNTKYRNQTVVRRAVAKILDQIDPAERVAIYAFGSQFRVLHDFSSDRASLLAKLKAYHGEVPDKDDLLEELDLDMGIASIPPDPVQLAHFDAGRILDTFGALEAIANHIKGVPGRKNLLWLSAAFPLTVGPPQRTIAPAPGHPGPLDQWRTFGTEMKQAMDALNDANVSVYPIDARGLSKATYRLDLETLKTSHDPTINISTMNSIAAETGGVAYANRNDLDRGVRLALDDSREVYVMTYYPKAITEDGAYHQIRVRTSRPGVQLRFRRGYYATGREEDRGVAAVDRLARALASPLDSSEIGIQASVEQSGGNDLAVVIHLDPADLSLAHSTERWTGSLRMVGVQIGATGERYEGQSQTAQLDLRPETYQRALAQGLRLEMRLKREPDAVAVRVAVVDERGAHVGSLSVPLPLSPEKGGVR
jgi:VWFA-related protein